MSTSTYRGKGLITNNVVPLNTTLSITGAGGLTGATGATGSITSNQAFTLGSNGLNTVNLRSFNEMFSNLGDTHPEVKKYEIYESPEDLLALSVTWKRLRDQGEHIVGKLLDRQLFSKVTPEDRDNAATIRDYYSKKVMMWKLKGNRLTPFREDLNSFVHSDGTKFKENVFGMVYYLPEFYQYDTQLDRVREQVKYKDLIINTIKTPGKLIQEKTLEPIAKIKLSTKRVKQNQYWFKDVLTDGAVHLTIDVRNPLEHIWNHIFENNSFLTINGHYFLRERDNFEYFSVAEWNLVHK